MAKAKKRSRSSSVGRNAAVIATAGGVSKRRTLPTLPRPVSLPRRPLVVVPALDARVFDPTAPESYARPPRTRSGRPARVVPAKPLPRRVALSDGSGVGLLGSPPAGLVFARPKAVAVCARRTTRRRVLAAIGKLGRNRYRKPLSSVRC